MTSDVLLVGCGELGSDIGLRLVDLGHEVAAIRRDVARVPAPLHGLAVDLTREAPRLPDLDLGLLVVALTARPRTEDSYRATYVEGMGRALDALDRAGQVPRRAVLVSSTAVLGSQDGDAPTDEHTPPRPADGPGRMLLEAERHFVQRVPTGTVLRLSGLYGHGSRNLQDRVREGRIQDPHRWTNRIHRDDAAAAVVHLLTREEQPARLYLGTDDEPAQLGEVAAFLAERLGAPTPPPADPARGHGKRLSNALLRSSGWEPAFPTFRQGYAHGEA
ncbi:hypothetical protein ACHAAC_13780 [Aeromicrobium sp. CF4.19]|uniref:hypothetical protein n=1 Tax=Aeromicrobium sp. CF4.19 TaxID=3373082 RepID=UPI003EE76C2F